MCRQEKWKHRYMRQQFFAMKEWYQTNLRALSFIALVREALPFKWRIFPNFKKIQFPARAKKIFWPFQLPWYLFGSILAFVTKKCFYHLRPGSCYIQDCKDFSCVLDRCLAHVLHEWVWITKAKPKSENCYRKENTSMSPMAKFLIPGAWYRFHFKLFLKI